MSRPPMRARLSLALMTSALLLLGLAACGEDGPPQGRRSPIESHPANGAVKLTVGSADTTEALILGEIYSQALGAAGYDVGEKLALGPGLKPLKALRAGEISGYPEYVSAAAAFFGETSGRAPPDTEEAYEEAGDRLARKGLLAYAPTPFSASRSVVLLTSRAMKLDVAALSDLEEQSQELILAGPAECPELDDCLPGLRKVYGLDFGGFETVDDGSRYRILRDGDADASIVSTTDPELRPSTDRYTVLRDDRRLFPAGNVIFVTDARIAKRAGPDYRGTIEYVQGGLTLGVMQVLNARVELEGKTPAQAAREYLEAFSYVE